ncbi:hypothetical protein [Polyangium jinanense]|uniref:Lipoprotein n=1 Tax=Polyangium jinanense TaxID=2829994 RepID=A0A9X3X3R7_9BACT|nr:hypothetical protein [Polyangium jinanense]MDC3958089.1 hypothetical protein [Polyangium jinanense]MDC3983712.1 hypothetical protein [Polyangium jinanense]
MGLLRSLSLLMVPFLGGCFFGSGDRELPPVEYSPGFFAAFDQMVDDTMSRGSLDEKARTLDAEFARRVDEGPGPNEVVAVGPTWDKVETFLSIGLLSAEIMAPIDGSEQSRVDILGHAADRVLRSDTEAIATWNRTVRDMGFADARIEPTGELVWESLYLVLTESEHAYQDVWVESGTWVEGAWVRTDGYYEQLWVDGYYESVWQDGACYDEYVSTECDTYTVEETCYDVYVEDGYWESYCSGYDDEGNCVEWTDEWVDTGYYETQCDPAYSYEECTDLYETVCDPGQWVDIWIEGHWVEGAWVPGELVWVEGYWSDTSGYRTVALPAQEAEILETGIAYVASLGPERVGADCYARLDEALVKSGESPPESAVKLSRGAILSCLSQH